MLHFLAIQRIIRIIRIARKETATITEQEVRDRIRAAVEQSGLTRSEWARQHGLWPSAVSEAINGPLLPSRSVLKAVGITRVKRRKEYEYKDAEDAAQPAPSAE